MTNVTQLTLVNSSRIGRVCNMQITLEILRQRAADGDRFAANALRAYKTDAELQRAIDDARNGR